MMAIGRAKGDLRLESEGPGQRGFTRKTSESQISANHAHGTLVGSPAML